MATEKRLIDADALGRFSFHIECEEDGKTFERCVVDWDDIEDAPTVDAVEVSRLGRLGKLMMPYEGCPRGKIGPTGSTGDSSDQKMQITTMDVITDVDGNRWVPVLDTDLEMLKSAEVVHGRWIPVTERLPEKSDYYLCCVKSFLFPGRTYINILGFCKDGFKEGHIYTDGVTHWMPLPEPPKEK